MYLPYQNLDLYHNLEFGIQCKPRFWHTKYVDINLDLYSIYL